MLAYLKKPLLCLILIIIVIPTSVIIHEFGHVMTGKKFGLVDHQILVWPGWQIYPYFSSTTYIWPKGAIAITSFNLPNDIPLTGSKKTASNSSNEKIESYTRSLKKAEKAWISLMGSGTTWLVSLLALMLMLAFKHSKVVFTLCLPLVFLYYDLLFYVALPTFFDLKHLVFWGSSVAEPLMALTTLGVSQSLAVGTVILVSATQSFCIYKIVNAKHRHKQSK